MSRFLYTYLPHCLIGLFALGMIGAEVIEWANLEIWIGSLTIFLGLIFALFFDKKYLIWLIWLFIPLSRNIDLPAGASLDFPGEGLLVLLAGIGLFGLLISKEFSAKKRISHPIAILILIDLIFGLITSLTSEIPLVSFKRLAIKTVFVLVFFFLMIPWFEKKNHLLETVSALLIGMALIIGYSMIRHGGYGFGIPYSPAMPRPFYDDHTIYGAGIAFLLPGVLLFLGRQIFQKVPARKILPIAGIAVLLLIGEFFSYSRAAWLSLIGAIFFWGIIELILWVEWNRLKIGSTLLLLGLSLFFLGKAGIQWIENNQAQAVDGTTTEHLASIGNLHTSVSNKERINRWLCAVRLFEERPILGWGPGTYQYVYGPFQKKEEMTRISTQTGDKGNAHSEYLTYLSEEGLPGLFIFLVLLSTAFFKGIRGLSNLKGENRMFMLASILGLMTFSLHGLFNSFLDQLEIAGLFYSVLALVVVFDSQQKKIKVQD